MAITDTLVTITSNGLTTVTTAYVANDCLDDVHTTTGFASANGGTGVITAVNLIDKSDVIGATTIYVFDTTVSLSDNAAFSITDAEALTYVGRIDMPPADDLASNRIAFTSCWVPFKCTGGVTNLYFALVTRSGHTFFGVNSDIQMRFNVTQTS